MKKRQFLLYLLKILVLVFVLAFILDQAYSFIFLQSNKRDKIGLIYNSKPKEYDVVILGSSRANNHFVTQMFEERGLKTYNFGMPGSKLFESDLVLKLLLEKKNKIKNVIIDVDITLRSEEKKSEGTILKFLPFLHRSPAIKKHYESLENFNSLYYIPFYRYLKYDAKIGFRQMFFYILDKKAKDVQYGGYEPKFENEELHFEDFTFPPQKNKYYEEIKRICKLNNIRLIPVMTPICSKLIGKDYFQKVNLLYPEIYNYEDRVDDDKNFSSCAHMNDAGAKKFTEIILEDFFPK
ncbi:hypothetical protein JC605_19080 [Flavobacterium sp. IB48]|nr:hypothetical protein [Flavobacterium sp. IB48]MBJ2126419.1 hypothetical protein [Flavobacterium sp. IB48]